MPRTKEELDSLAIIDPEIDKSKFLYSIFTVYSNFLHRCPRKPSEVVKAFSSIAKRKETSIDDRVEEMRALYSRVRPPPAIPDVTERNPKYTTRDGAELDLFVFHPTNQDKGLRPLLILYHGGGGVIGTAYSMAPLARDLVVTLDCIVISVQYRLAPEHPFPTGVNDAWDAFVHITTRASTFSAHPSVGLLVGGASHGAVLTSIIALQAKASNETPRITGLYFAAPAFIATQESIPERYRDRYRSKTDQRCLNAPILDTKTKALFDTALGAELTSPLYRALNVQPISNHDHLAPRAYFQVCGLDVLRDDALIYEQIP